MNEKNLRETINWIIHNKNQEKGKVNFLTHNNGGNHSKR